MRKRRLKKFVLPVLYLLITVSIFTGVILLGVDYSMANKDYNYSVSLVDEEIKPVMNTDEEMVTDILPPVEENTASISVNYYEKDDSIENQEKSIIYYENTYLPNTGILYESNESFNVLSAFSGTVEDIRDDNFFGKYIIIEHSNNLKTYYYGLEDIEVNIGDEVTRNAVLGVAKNNEINNDKKTFLFEVYYNNKLLNPSKFIGTKITDYK